MLKKVLILIVSFFMLNCSEEIKFNSSQWIDWKESEANPNTRWLMVNDLLKKHDLKSYKKQKIIELLGNPTTNKNNDFYYYLGYTGNGINTGTLIVKFKDDNVIKIEVIQG
jgi:hypothetical protein